VLALARLELRRAFRTPVGFAVAGLYLLVHGFYFVSLMGAYSTSSLQAISMGQTPSRLNLVDMVLQPLAMADTFLLLLLLPGITMRVFADEWRSGTAELLLSYPMRGGQIVAGKFLGASVMLLGLLVLGSLSTLAALFFGALELPTVLAQFLALLLFGLSCIAVGTLFSAITENQVLAYGLTVVTLFCGWFLGWWERTLSGVWAELAGWISPATHFSPASLGLLRLSDLVYFGGIIAFSLYLCIAAVEARRAGGGRN
jgi:ABC-2 type transport system permease protein